MILIQKVRIARFLKVVLVILFAAVSSGSASDEAEPPGIQVSLNASKHLWLHITLRSAATGPATFPRYKLPWGWRYSMIFVAIGTRGEPVELQYPIDDPTPDKITVGPRAALAGDIDLQDVIFDLDRKLKKSEVHLFWAYKPPEVLGLPRWSGGWVLIPQQE